MQRAVVVANYKNNFMAAPVVLNKQNNSSLQEYTFPSMFHVSNTRHKGQSYSSHNFPQGPCICQKLLASLVQRLSQILFLQQLEIFSGPTY